MIWGQLRWYDVVKHERGRVPGRAMLLCRHIRCRPRWTLCSWRHSSSKHCRRTTQRTGKKGTTSHKLILIRSSFGKGVNNVDNDDIGHKGPPLPAALFSLLHTHKQQENRADSEHSPSFWHLRESLSDFVLVSELKRNAFWLALDGVTRCEMKCGVSERSNWKNCLFKILWFGKSSDRSSRKKEL